MNGYELARRFRAEPRYRDLFLVALTGYGREATAARRTRQVLMDTWSNPQRLRCSKACWQTVE
jgi:CheY-like chemotaxis protein